MKKKKFKIKKLYLNENYPCYKGEVFGKINNKKVYFRFTADENKIAFLGDIPFEGDELQKKVLIKTYSELHKMLAEWRIKEFFQEQKEKEEKEKREIKINEQVSIEKYLMRTSVRFSLTVFPHRKKLECFFFNNHTGLHNTFTFCRDKKLTAWSVRPNHTPATVSRLFSKNY